MPNVSYLIKNGNIDSVGSMISVSSTARDGDCYLITDTFDITINEMPYTYTKGELVFWDAQLGRFKQFTLPASELFTKADIDEFNKNFQAWAMHWFADTDKIRIRLPQIIDNTWWLWDYDQEKYVNSGNPSIGPQGPQGYQGNQGEPGSQGYQGSQGSQGSQGYQGNQGEKGENAKLVIYPTNEESLYNKITLDRDKGYSVSLYVYNKPTELYFLSDVGETSYTFSRLKSAVSGNSKSLSVSTISVTLSQVTVTETTFDPYSGSQSGFVPASSGAQGAQSRFLNELGQWATIEIHGDIEESDLGRMIAPQYNQNNVYNTDDYVLYDKKLWKCNQDNVSGAWDSSKWTQTLATNLFSASSSGLVPRAPASDPSIKFLNGNRQWVEIDISGALAGYIQESDLGRIIVPLFDSTKTSANPYPSGSYCIHNKSLYKSNKETSGEFDLRDWDAINIIQLINDKIGDLGKVLSYKGSASVSDLNSVTTYRIDGAVYSISDSGTITPHDSSWDGSVKLGDEVTWITDKWVYLGNITTIDLSEYITESNLEDIIANELDPSSTYSVNDFVLINKKLYVCDTAGVGNQAHFTEFKVTNVFQGSTPGLVPAATSNEANKVLKGDGWGDIVNISYDAQAEELHMYFGPDPFYDNFVLVYNGSYDSGLSINHGSFGNAISDDTCPVKFASCFDLGEITIDSTLKTPSLSWYYPTELETLFNSSNWTLDFWIKYSTINEVESIYLGNANSISQSPFATLRFNTNGTFYCNLFGNSSASQVPISNGWHHFAFILGGNNPGIYFDGTRLITKGNTPYGGRVSIYLTKASATGIRIANIGLRSRSVWSDSFTPPTKLYCQNP